MCDICVIESVKARMLSRRDLFRGAAASVAVGAVAATPSLAQGAGRVVDLTHTLSPSFPTYGGDPGIALDLVLNFAENGYNLNQISLAEHSGTHIDAPLHFSADGTAVDELAMGELVAPLVCIDIREKAAGDADAMVTPDDVQAWADAHGEIPEGACVAMLSGWAARVGGEDFRNADADGVMHFPGFHKEATDMLLETGAASIGVDTLSLDPGNSADFAVHYSWLPAGRFGIECLAGLEDVPAAGATIVIGAPKWAGGTGGPARVFALV